MDLEGVHEYPDGKRELYRMKFVPEADGSVRQIIHQSKDVGASWYLWFEGIYRKAGTGD